MSETPKGTHMVEISHFPADGEYEVLAFEEVVGSVRLAKKRCVELAKTVSDYPSVSRSRGVVYLPDGTPHNETLNLDLLMWEQDPAGEQKT